MSARPAPGAEHDRPGGAVNGLDFAILVTGVVAALAVWWPRLVERDAVTVDDHDAYIEALARAVGVLR